MDQLEGPDQTGTSAGAYSHFSGGVFDQPGQPQIRWYLNGAWRDNHPEPVTSEWLNAADNFAAALRDGAELVCSGREGRRRQAILDAMYRSVYNQAGDWVKVKPDLRR